MKPGIRFLASISLALIFTCSFIIVVVGQESTPATSQRGVVTYVKGSVKKKQVDSLDWKNAYEKTEVYSGEKVKTFEESRAEMELRELDVIRLAPNTTIDIIKLYEETKEHRDETQIDLLEGDLWAQVGKVDADASFQLNSPVAGSAITGTSLRINVNADSSTQLKVYAGEVKITNAPERKDLIPQPLPVVTPTHGQTPGSIQGPTSVSGPTSVAGPNSVTLEEWVYIVKNMQQVTIDPRGQVMSSGKFKRSDPDEQTDWVKWNKERDKLLNR